MPRSRIALAGLFVLALLACLALAGCKTLGKAAKTDSRATPDARTTATVLAKEHVQAAGDAEEQWNITFDIDGRSVTFDAENLYGYYVAGQKVDMTYYTHTSGATTITESSHHLSEPGPPTHAFASVAVDESFVDDRYHWIETDTDKLLVRRESGSVRMAARGAEAKVRKLGMDADFGAGFRMEMDVAMAAGPTEGFARHVGLLWGMAEDGDYRGLFLSDAGRFLYGGFSGGKWRGMKRWWNFPGVSLGGVNTLAVTRLGDVFILEVNGRRLAEMPAMEAAGPGLGFFVSKDAEAVISRISVFSDALPAASAPAPTGTAGDDAEAKAARLGKLRDAGLITPEEFDAKMRQLAPPEPAASTDPKAALKARMDDLERLRAAGLVSEEEYEARRAALIDQYLGR